VSPINLKKENEYATRDPKKPWTSPHAAEFQKKEKKQKAPSANRGKETAEKKERLTPTHEMQDEPREKSRKEIRNKSARSSV